MKRNGRLSLALHALAHMACDPSRPHTSAEIAEHIGTNAVVVRRVLGKLREAELLKSEKGRAGGWTFARDPKKITFADVYLSIDESLISGTGSVTACQCLLEQSVQETIFAILDNLEKDLVQKLGDIKISKITEY